MIESIFNRITPYFPIFGSSIYQNDPLRKHILERNKFFSEFMEKVFSINIFLIVAIVITLKTTFNIQFEVLNQIKNNYLNLLTVENLKLLPLIIIFLGIIFSLFYISKKGLLIRAKNNIFKKEAELKIQFHKQNRMYLSKISYDFFENVNKLFIAKNDLINDVSQYSQSKNPIYIQKANSKLKLFSDIQEIEKLNEYSNTFIIDNKDVFPFVIQKSHSSFFSLMNHYGTYLDVEFPKDLNNYFLTRGLLARILDTEVNTINRNPHLFDKDKLTNKINHLLIKKIEALIDIQNYLLIINRELNNKNHLYKFFGLITNKYK
ncbi:hypothetical protein HNQ94_001219 [Salirhabdus euzebyi]|uniref:Uncharacterized protein n=1 Tax=Salirhabdus euzebyi TaxID=394506 RepID=A0A841Q292_9BACI|nr:hypothetical protein [Salirhabdus euzebyi]MBB6452773.1 hypothetical protein [Salirhabdus euzebyi]